MAEELIKYKLQQAYIREKAARTEYKGPMKVNPQEVAWEKVGDFLETQGIPPEFYVGYVFDQVVDPNRVHPNVLISERHRKGALAEFMELKSSSDLEDEFDGIRPILLKYCYRETGGGDLGDVEFKKALWKGTYDGIPPFIRILTLYPELPKNPETLEHHLVKSMLRDAYTVFSTRPDIKPVCDRMKIELRELLNWEVFNDIR